MPVEYTYPKLRPDWEPRILLFKIMRLFDMYCGEEMNLESIGTSTSEVGVSFKTELTNAQKQKLDALMAMQDAGLVPSPIGFTRFQIKHVEYALKQLESACENKILVIPVSSDVTQLWIKGTLTNGQKNKLKDLYLSLVSEMP